MLIRFITVYALSFKQKGMGDFMNKKIALLLALIICVGCSSGKDQTTDDQSLDNNTSNANVTITNDSENDSVEKQTDMTESFMSENYDCFPEIKNIVNYLKLSADDVNIIEQNDEAFIFCFYTDISTQNESEPSYDDYVNLLEKEGYEVSIYDATISQTFLLENEKYTISLTIISNIDEWKKVHQEEMDTDKMTDENVVCEIYTKN